MNALQRADSNLCMATANASALACFLETLAARLPSLRATLPSRYLAAWTSVIVPLTKRGFRCGVFSFRRYFEVNQLTARRAGSLQSATKLPFHALKTSSVTGSWSAKSPRLVQKTPRNHVAVGKSAEKLPEVPRQRRVCKKMARAQLSQRELSEREVLYKFKYMK